MRTNVTSMDAIRRRLRSLFGSGSGAAKRPDDRRSDSDRRAGDERRERLSLPPVERGAPFGQRAPLGQRPPRGVLGDLPCGVGFFRHCAEGLDDGRIELRARAAA